MPTRAVKTLAQCQALCAGECLMVTDDLGKAVERNPVIKVMDMVNPDIGGKPSQNGWKDVM